MSSNTLRTHSNVVRLVVWLVEQTQTVVQGRLFALAGIHASMRWAGILIAYYGSGYYQHTAAAPPAAALTIASGREIRSNLQVARRTARQNTSRRDRTVSVGETGG